MVCSRVHLRIPLTAQPTAHFTRAGVAMTNTADSIIAHTPWEKNKLKRRQERDREAGQNELKIQKSKDFGKDFGKNKLKL